ncbi:MAG: hypoxanthine phosphoribosyltransferase [Clostridia bacterium]|nr:hypoxanthine phosphoribosyltransferase [Clostridia bacterium]
MISDNAKKTNSLADDIESVLFTEQDLDGIVSKVAKEITEHYYEKVLVNKEKLVILGVLNGSFQFVSDLVKKIDLPLEIEFMFASSYGKKTKSTGEVNIQVGKNPEVLDDPNANIIIVEDIVDSGNTLSKLMSVMRDKGNKSVALCSLFDKPERRTVEIDVDFLGAKVPDEFIVGYGLDYDEKYRNMPFVGVLKREIYEN